MGSYLHCLSANVHRHCHRAASAQDDSQNAAPGEGRSHKQTTHSNHRRTRQTKRSGVNFLIQFKIRFLN